MKFNLLPCVLLAVLASFPTLPAAINPSEYQRIASDIVRLHQIARLVQTDRIHSPKWRRVTIMAKVVAVHQSRNLQVGDSILIDYSVDLIALDKAAKAHESSHGNMPGPQFMFEPEPPELDDKGEFWAHLAKSGGRLGNVNRHAGAMVFKNEEILSGPIFVPVSGQYSFAQPE